MSTEKNGYSFIELSTYPLPSNTAAYYPRGPSPWDYLKRAVFWLTVAAIVLLLGLAVRAEPIKVPQEFRADNRNDNGICWWSSAQTLGHYLGIVPLQDITDQVVKTGIGYKTGATQESVDHWMKTLRLKPRSNPYGVTQEGVNWLCKQLDQGLPVVISYRDGNNADGSPATHAVLLIEITRQKAQFKGKEDYGVRYIDPNHKDKEDFYNFAWFMGAWTGRAYTFDPKEQDPALVRAQPPPRPRVMANGQILPGFRTTEIPPIEIRQQMPPYLPHEIPYTMQNATNPYGVYYVPSNQDIKDGVARPDDQVRYGAFSEYQKPREPFIVRVPVKKE